MNVDWEAIARARGDRIRALIEILREKHWDCDNLHIGVITLETAVAAAEERGARSALLHAADSVIRNPGDAAAIRSLAEEIDVPAPDQVVSL